MMMIKFLSNKWNLFGLCALSYTMIGLIMEMNGFTFSQVCMSFVAIAIGNLSAYLYGMSKGIIQTTMERPQFIQELDKINEMIRKDNKKAFNSSLKEPTNKKRKKKGCGSGKCNKC